MSKIRIEDIEVVITSFNQGNMILEAVESVIAQTIQPRKIIIVDDGSTDLTSLNILKKIESDETLLLPITVHYQENKGVSSARNIGIRMTNSPLVLVLDGDDKLEPEYIEEVASVLIKNPKMVAASSYLHTFGVLDSTVCPSGGDIVSFLSRNCSPASHIMKREAFDRCGGYDESMRLGFEDWDFFLTMLTSKPDTYIGIVEKPLINYRTSAESFNIKSMEKRLKLMKYIIEKHKEYYKKYVVDVLLNIEASSISRLQLFENEILYSLKNKQNLSPFSSDFLKSPTYGDGGMAAAVRIASILNPMHNQDLQ